MAHEERGGQAHPVAAQHLERAQLVAGDADRVGGVQAEDAELLELTHDRGSEERDRGADTGNHRVVAAELLLPVVEPGRARGDLDGEGERVEDAHLVAAHLAGLLEPSRAVEAGTPRQDCDSHLSPLTSFASHHIGSLRVDLSAQLVPG